MFVLPLDGQPYLFDTETNMYVLHRYLLRMESKFGKAFLYCRTILQITAELYCLGRLNVVKVKNCCFLCAPDGHNFARVMGCTSVLRFCRW